MAYSRQVRGVGVAINERIPDAMMRALGFERPALPAPQTTYVPLESWPVGQKVALLKRSKSELSEIVLGHLHETGVKKFSAEDEDFLEREGYLTRRQLRPGWRAAKVLTPRGLHAAQTIARDLARKFKLHHISYGMGRGRIASCICGGFKTNAHNSWEGQRRLEIAAGQHLSTAPGRPYPEFPTCN